MSSESNAWCLIVDTYSLEKITCPRCATAYQHTSLVYGHRPHPCVGCGTLLSKWELYYPPVTLLVAIDYLPETVHSFWLSIEQVTKLQGLSEIKKWIEQTTIPTLVSWGAVYRPSKLESEAEPIPVARPPRKPVPLHPRIPLTDKTLVDPIWQIYEEEEDIAHLFEACVRLRFQRPRTLNIMFVPAFMALAEPSPLVVDTKTFNEPQTMLDARRGMLLQADYIVTVDSARGEVGVRSADVQFPNDRVEQRHLFFVSEETFAGFAADCDRIFDVPIENRVRGIGVSGTYMKTLPPLALFDFLRQQGFIQ